MKIKGLIFDFDGTLATPSALDFAQLNQTLAAKTAAFGYAWPQEGYVLERLGQFAGYAVEKLGQERGRALAAELKDFVANCEVEAARESRLFAFTPMVLAESQKLGLKTAIVSRNCSPAILSVYPDASSHVFLPRDRVKLVKPDAGHFLQAARAMAVDIKECAAIGDHAMDMEAAVASGCLPIGVLSGLSPAPLLREKGAKIILDDISGLLACLKQKNLV